MPCITLITPLRLENCRPIVISISSVGSLVKNQAPLITLTPKEENILSLLYQHVK